MNIFDGLLLTSIAYCLVVETTLALIDVKLHSIVVRHCSSKWGGTTTAGQLDCGDRNHRRTNAFDMLTPKTGKPKFPYTIQI